MEHVIEAAHSTDLKEGQSQQTRRQMLGLRTLHSLNKLTNVSYLLSINNFLHAMQASGPIQNQILIPGLKALV